MGYVVAIVIVFLVICLISILSESCRNDMNPEDAESRLRLENIANKIRIEEEKEAELGYYNSYLPEVIQEDLEERALIKMLEDCKIAVEYYKIEDSKKVKYYEYCVQLCEEKLERIRNEQQNNSEQTTD